MNLYLRYFNEEVLAHNIDEVVDFLSNIPDLHFDEGLIEDIQQFLESNVSYPKRYKVRPRVYFIVIKTLANTMEEFKSHSASNKNDTNQDKKGDAGKNSHANSLLEEAEGWYEGSIVFKRVIPILGTGKFQYSDTKFVAQMKATSGQNCYDRIIEHLKNRQDVDLRSQFPSVRGHNFTFVFLGKERPE